MLTPRRDDFLPNRRGRGTAALFFLFVVFLPTLGTAPVAAADAPADAEAVIPTGREEMLAAMLGRGAPLPEGCAFSGGQVEYSVVKATYTCPAGEVVYQLSHPGKAPAAAARSERFALTLLRGAAPDALTTALIARLRSAEAGFEWQWVGKPRGAPRSWPVPLAAVALLTLAVLGWFLRKRVSRKRTPSPRA